VSDASGAPAAVAAGRAGSTVPGSNGGVVPGGMAGASAGMGAAGASAAAGATAAAGAAAPAAPSGDTFVMGVNVAVHPEVSTILVVTWMQTVASESTWLEFSFEGGTTMKSRAVPGAAGMHRDVVLGVPAQTAVTLRIVNRQAGVEAKSRDYTGMTGALPMRMPKPIVMDYNPQRASPDRWLFGAVEDSDGGCNSGACYYHTTFWLYIIDRQGRVVWYYADPASNATSSFQRIARDGEYIWIEKRPAERRGNRSVLKMTLDRSYSEEIPVPNLSDCIDVTDSGSLLYDIDRGVELREMTPDGQHRTIWTCSEHFPEGFDCYTNTVNWNRLTDSVVMSFPYERTVLEVDRQSGRTVGQYGAAEGSYGFEPATWEFGFQHFANITLDGTLLVSSHMPGFRETTMPVAGEHAFVEFEIDRANRKLKEKWVYHEGKEWAMYKGMAIRLPNGNTLGNYGTGGVIREITPDKLTVFYVKFDSPNGNDFFNKMVGHNVLVDDLYALNGGPRK
jgi:hypothetical protein